MKKVIIGLLFLTIFATGCMQKNTVKLEYKYNPGEVLKHKITLINDFVLDVHFPSNIPSAMPISSTETTTVSTPEGTATTQETAPLPSGLNKRHEINTRLELLCIKNIKNVAPDGIITIEERFEPLSEEILINKESTLLEGCSVSDILRDKTLILRITTSGSVLSTEGLDELLKDVYNRISLLGMDTASRSRIGDVLRYEVEQIIQQSISMFPGGKLTKGDTWKRESIGSLPIIGIKSTVTHTDMFNGFETVHESDCAKITGSITSTLSNEKPELSTLIGEMANKVTEQSVISVNGAERGTTLIHFEHKKGQMLKNQILKEGFVNVTVPLMMGTVTSGTIEIKMTTKTKYIIEKYDR